MKSKLDLPTPVPTTTPMIDMAAVARLLGVGKRTVQTWLSSGQMPPADFAVGKTRCWYTTTIERWISASGKGQGWATR